MTNYDSILEEKKKYNEPEKVIKKKKFPWLLLDIIIITIILVVSYFIYYRSILSSENIFMTDIYTILDNYKVILNGLPINELDSDYSVEGTLSLNDLDYKYNIINKDNKFKTFLSINDKNMTYYSDYNNQYVNFDFLGEEYISLSNSKLKNNIINKEYLETSEFKEKYIKNFYLDNYTPVVEANLVLKNEDIKNIIKQDLKKNYEVILTFKNNAFTNEIIDMKIIINNLTDSNRKLITYQDGVINYSSDKGVNLKFTLSAKNNDFTLKIYKNDQLHSVLTGNKNEKSYKYLYQVIDKVYNISLVSSIEENMYKFKIISNVQVEEEFSYDEMLITLKSIDIVDIDDINLKNVKKYNNLTKEEKKDYKDSFNNTIGDLRNLINKYKNNI